MKDREEARSPSNIPELIRRTKCGLKTCPNYDHNCIVLPQQKHVSLCANDFVTWDKAIEEGKATLDVPPMSVRGIPVPSKKTPIVISNVNTGNSFQMGIPSQTAIMPYPFMHGYNPYPLPMPYPAPPPPTTPIRTHDQRPNVGIFSSPIDVSSATNNDVAGFMDWMVGRAKDARESDALIEAKEKLVDAMVDLDIIKNMLSTEFIALNIPFGVGKRLARETKSFMKK